METSCRFSTIIITTVYSTTLQVQVASEGSRANAWLSCIIKLSERYGCYLLCSYYPNLKVLVGNNSGQAFRQRGRRGGVPLISYYMLYIIDSSIHSRAHGVCYASIDKRARRPNLRYLMNPLLSTKALGRQHR